MKHNLQIGSMIKHRTTGAILKVIKIGKPTLFTYIVDLGTLGLSAKVGDKNKTSVNAIGVTYDIIFTPSQAIH